MSAAIAALQEALVTAWRADAALTALVPADRIGDGPPRGASGAHVAIERHDVVARDADLAPGLEHRLRIGVVSTQPSRAALTEIVELVLAAALAADLSSAALAVTLARHVGTQTFIDTRSGHARAIIDLRCLSEPNS